MFSVNQFQNCACVAIRWNFPAIPDLKVKYPVNVRRTNILTYIIQAFSMFSVKPIFRPRIIPFDNESLPYHVYLISIFDVLYHSIFMEKNMMWGKEFVYWSELFLNLLDSTNTRTVGNDLHALCVFNTTILPHNVCVLELETKFKCIITNIGHKSVPHMIQNAKNTCMRYA